MIKLGLKKIDIKAGSATSKRGMDKHGRAELFLASEVRRLCDPYVPKRQGVLKNTATIRPGAVEYVQPYARRQYYENRGKGMRGPYWERRMMAQRGSSLRKAIATFIGGKSGG